MPVVGAVSAAPDPGMWVPVVGALVALAGVLLTLAQKWRNDRRDAWWKRTQWALDKLMDANGDEEARAIALTALQYLQKTPLATDSDRELLDDVATQILSWGGHS